MRPRFSVRCHLAPHTDLYHASMLLTGLEMLASQGQIVLSFEWKNLSLAMLADDLTIAVEVSDLEHECSFEGAFDVRDQNNRVAQPLLERVDVYWMRSLHREFTRVLAAKEADKLLPLGMNYPCRTLRSLSRMTQVTGRLARKGGILRSLLGPRRWRDSTLHRIATSPTVGSFEYGPTQPVDAVVLFQTRVWEKDECWPDDAGLINDERVTLTRTLKQAFGKRFVGGLVPTPLALRQFPDLVTDIPTRRSAYVYRSKRAAVGVYTRGLHQSTAFKLPEYLAASKATVASPPSNETPEPLRSGVHYAPFESAQDCVRECDVLLSHAQRLSEMRGAAWEYYAAHVRPDRAILGCLERGLLRARNNKSGQGRAALRSQITTDGQLS